MADTNINIVDVNYRDPDRVKVDGYQDHLRINWYLNEYNKSERVYIYSHAGHVRTHQVFDRQAIDDLITVLTYWRDEVCSQ